MFSLEISAATCNKWKLFPAEMGHSSSISEGRGEDDHTLCTVILYGSSCVKQKNVQVTHDSIISKFPIV